MALKMYEYQLIKIIRNQTCIIFMISKNYDFLLYFQNYLSGWCTSAIVYQIICIKIKLTYKNIHSAVFDECLLCDRYDASPLKKDT